MVQGTIKRVTVGIGSSASLRQALGKTDAGRALVSLAMFLDDEEYPSAQERYESALGEAVKRNLKEER